MYREAAKNIPVGYAKSIRQPSSMTALLLHNTTGDYPREQKMPWKIGKLEKNKKTSPLQLVADPLFLCYRAFEPPRFACAD
jgi:hypothetical protein